MKTGDQLLGVYIFDNRRIELYGCFDDDSEEQGFDFYDVYDEDTRECLNEGSPFYVFPTWLEVRELLR